MKGHLRLYRGGGDGKTLPEWLKGEGKNGTARVYNNTLKQHRPKSQISELFVIWIVFFVL